MKGKKIGYYNASKIARILCSPVFVSYVSPNVAKYYKAAFEYDTVFDLFYELSAKPGPHVPGVLFVQSFLFKQKGNIKAAKECLERAVSIGPDPIGQLARKLEEIKQLQINS